MSSLSTSRLLLIDSDKEYGLKLANDLEQQGVQVVVSDSYEESVELLSTETFNLVLADLSVCNAAGASVPEYLKAQNFADLAVITSAQPDFEVQRMGVLPATSTHILKPVNAEHLLQIIRLDTRKNTLERENQALRILLSNSQEIHSYMIESSPDIIYLLDSDGCFTYINERAEDLLGYRKIDLIGKHYSVLVREDDLDKARYCFNEKRTGDRSTRNAGMWLKCTGHDNKSSYFDTKNLAIELNAMWVYKEIEHGSTKESG